MDVSDQNKTHEGRVQVSNKAAALATLSDQGREAAKDVLFGSIAGIVGKLIEYPFDTIKVRLQAQPEHLPLRYTGPLDCFKQALHHDGFAGLYRGISAPLFGAAVETSSLFFSYRLAQDILQSTVLSETEELSLPSLVLCGAISGAYTSLLLTPIELIKCKMQVPFIKTAGTHQPPGISSIISSVYRHQGVSGFWHGQMGTLIRETGGSAAWFGSYESMKVVFRKWNKSTAESDELPIWQRLSAGALAGMSYNFIFYPADTIKSRMQTEDVSQIAKNRHVQRTFWAVGRGLWQSQGLKGLYRGCGITLGRAAPSSAFIFTVYEGLKKHFG